MIDNEALLARHDYAIIDRVGQFLEPWFESLPLTILVPPEMKGDAERMPALLPLTPDAPYLPRLVDDLEQAQQKSYHRPLISCLLKLGPEPPKHKPEYHLQDRLILYRAGTGFKTYLRYFDSRVFLHLDRILTLPYILTLYGPFVEWTVRFNNLDGETVQKDWVTLPVPKYDGLVPLFWRAKPEQLDAMSRIPIVNLALSLLQEKIRKPWSLDRWKSLALWADELIVAEQQSNPEATNKMLARYTRDTIIQTDFHYQHYRGTNP
jgi:hypothetical protein